MFYVFWIVLPLAILSCIGSNYCLYRRNKFTGINEWDRWNTRMHVLQVITSILAVVTGFTGGQLYIHG